MKEFGWITGSAAEQTLHPWYAIDQHAPGAKLDNGKIRADLVLGSFACALERVAEVGTFGAAKYSPDGWLSVPDSVSRYSDAMIRHYLALSKGEQNDTESGLPHLAHMAWNVLAVLELQERKK